ncbi:response regulator transcription factor [Actinopolymorpha alba]|uniref:response regulator transcription factor n=1 Tax=Actinopolymorpha alba TaxID=533267 RepID=UPI0003659A05|nr:response regulator transcription factor [Actinopolymorpha alba]
MSAENTASPNGSSSGDSTGPLRVLVYSDDRNTRDKVKFGIGKRPERDLPPVEFLECATQPAVLKALDAGGIDVVILDGEAVPAGGMGLARQLKDEIFHCPPILVLTGRVQDAWLATWSRADAAVPYPLDPVALCRTTVTLARKRLAASSAR